MGNGTEVCPLGNDEKNGVIGNLCTDTGSYAPNPPNVCIPGDPSDSIPWFQSLGGIGGNPSSDTKNPVSFQNSEFGNNSKYGESCLTAASNDNIVCTYTNGADSNGLYVQKIANYGDPLLCCLRDFQCNEAQNNDVSGASCFSDNSGTNTCPSSFRATDTMPCQFLTTQYCLGNIGDSLDPTSDFDFTALWVNPTSDLLSGPIPDSFKVYPLPVNYKYKLQIPYNYDASVVYPRSSVNISPSILGICELDPATGEPIDNSNGNLSSCPRNAVVTSNGINPAIPYNTDADFNFGNTPPCQAIFWRTLYGNEPEFQNQYWRNNNVQVCEPFDAQGNEQIACLESSNAPQGASCASQGFAGIPTPSGVEWSKTTLTAAVNKIKNIYNQSIITPPNLQSTAPFFSWLFSVCSTYPYLCKDFLEDECSNVTPELLDNSPGVRNWCGCYLSDNFYDTYTNDFINKECTPYCNSSSVIPLSQADGTAPQYCEQSVCIIDDVAIKLAKTEFEGNGGSINFNQMCGSCGSNYQNSINKTNFPNTGNTQSYQTGSTTTKNGSQTATIASNTSQLNSTLINDVADITCQCRINNFTLTSLGGSFIGGINLAQSCGGDSKCYGSQTDPTTGQTTSSEVDCSNSAAAIDLKVQNLKASLAKKAESTSNFWSILIVFIVFALIIIIWLFFVTRGVPEKDLTFSRNVLNTDKESYSSYGGLQNSRKLVYKGPVIRKF